MPKYLIQGSYTTEGIAVLRASGASARAQQVRAFIEGAGGKMDAIYWAFGDNDAVLMVDFPDNATAAGVATAVAEAGQIRLRTTVLLTAEEMDHGVKVKTGPMPGTS